MDLRDKIYWNFDFFCKFLKILSFLLHFHYKFEVFEQTISEYLEKIISIEFKSILLKFKSSTSFPLTKIHHISIIIVKQSPHFPQSHRNSSSIHRFAMF